MFFVLYTDCGTQEEVTLGYSQHYKLLTPNIVRISTNTFFFNSLSVTYFVSVFNRYMLVAKIKLEDSVAMKVRRDAATISMYLTVTSTIGLKGVIKVT